MVKATIKKLFFEELLSDFPNIPNIPNISCKKKRNKKKIILVTSLLSISSVIACSSIIIFSSIKSVQEDCYKELFISPKTNDHGIQSRGDCADWKTFIKTNVGPFAEQRIDVTFYHGSWFSDALNGEGPTISYMNNEQITILSLIRIVGDVQYIIYEHTGTLYEHLCGDIFSKTTSFCFSDTVTVDCLLNANENKVGSIGYMVTIKGINNAPLDYKYLNDPTTDNYIYSERNSYIGYKIVEKGILFYEQ